LQAESLPLFDSTEDQVAAALEAMAEDPSGVQMGGAEYKPDQPTGRFKQSDHNERTVKYLEGLGYFACRADQWKTTYNGTQYRLDFLGIFDFLGFKDGGFVGVQVSATSDMGSHCSKMWSADKTTFNNRTKCENLKRFLECGGRVLVLGWALGKVGNAKRWLPTERWLSLLDVEAAIARREKRGMPAARSRGPVRRRR
jgi:hypothetical protein